MEDEGLLDFNFWPSFADLMLSLVLILVLVLFLVASVITAGTVNLSHVEKNQRDMVNAVAAKYASEPKRLSEDTTRGETTYGIALGTPNNYDIVIKNERGLQRITFSDKILFLPDDDQLNDVGQGVLRVVGDALRQQLPLIREMQIQGHADTDRSSKFPSNLHLATSRAIRVYTFLQQSTGINPSEHLMSVTSFGEYKPVQRAEDKPYNQERLILDNSTQEMKGKNRRIELLLFYRI